MALANLLTLIDDIASISNGGQFAELKRNFFSPVVFQYFCKRARFANIVISF